MSKTRRYDKNDYSSNQKHLKNKKTVKNKQKKKRSSTKREHSDSNYDFYYDIGNGDFDNLGTRK